MSLRVTLQIYSGRRNPQWRVSGDLETQLREALAELKSGPPWDPPTRLGYRGIRIVQDTPRGSWQCVRGRVLRRDEAGTHWFSDPECKVETLALETGRSVLDPVRLDHLIRMLTLEH